jgi:hypothetical protein
MERPTPIEPRRLQKLFALRSNLQAQLAEVDMEIQRIQMGQQPHDLSPVLRPTDRFWRQTIDFNQTRAEQANGQTDKAFIPSNHYNTDLR